MTTKQDTNPQQDAPPETGLSIQQEPVTPPETDPGVPELQTTGGFTAEDIAKARREEKDKVYDRIGKLQDELKAVREAEEAQKRQLEEEAERKRLEAEKKAEEEMDVRSLFQKKEQEWDQKLTTLQQEIAARDAMLEKEREYNALMEYRSSVMDANREAILPELLDLVTGDSREEIDAAAQRLAERTNSILGNVQQVQTQQQAAAQQARTQMPGVAPTNPSADPMDMMPTTRTYSPEEIAAMTPGEYAKVRDQLKAAAITRAKSGGLYTR